MRMPEPDADVIARRAEIIKVMRSIVPAENVLEDDDELRVYETDALSAYRQMPLIVVLPETTLEVSKILKYCQAENVKIVPRGAGTGLTGATLPLADAITLAMGKFNRILDIDFENRCVVAQPGCTNLSISDAVAERGFYYAPDPSSQIACSIGGNIGTNAGGVHCLKYGL
ncbi:MAG: FAD-binding protein, partial [Rhodospirillales bacterium]